MHSTIAAFSIHHTFAIEAKCKCNPAKEAIDVNAKILATAGLKVLP
ncbi:hypothetical protein [Xanthomonas sp. GPE 39]|nr:hypothetical protein [Xanthomonas sp. GPE 39]